MVYALISISFWSSEQLAGISLPEAQNREAEGGLPVVWREGRHTDIETILQLKTSYIGQEKENSGEFPNFLKWRDRELSEILSDQKEINA